MSSVTSTTDIKFPRLAQVWHAEDGTICATVLLGIGASCLSFDSAKDARAVAAVCTAAAEEIEHLASAAAGSERR